MTAAILALAGCCGVLEAAAPSEWTLMGSRPRDYEVGFEPESQNGGRPSVYLRSRTGAAGGYGTLGQHFHAEQYRGKRVRFSAAVRCEGVQDSAGLWMRVHTVFRVLASDYMRDRPLRGTTPWTGHAVVLDVPQEATHIALGVVLNGPGSVWLSDADFEVVGPEVPVTDTVSAAKGPRNLDFEKE